MLMDLETLDWDDELLGVLRHPAVDAAGDPAVVATRAATARRWPNGPFGGEVPLTGDLGDQQAATVGQVCFAPGEAKNTYGTGNFMLLNTGTELVRSKAGLLTTVCYKFGDEPPVYALEGSIAVTGSAVQWLRDQLGIISRRRARARRWPARSRTTAASTSCRRSPACSRRTGAPTPAARSSGCPGSTPTRTWPGPRWRRSATRAATSSRRWRRTPASHLDVLKVDGGVTANELCMQIQADILGVPVSRPVVAETTALGAAYAAGLAVGFWNDTDELREQLERGQALAAAVERRAARRPGTRGWKKAVERTLDWVDVD